MSTHTSDGTGPIPADSTNANTESKDDTKAKMAGWDELMAAGIQNPERFFAKAARYARQNQRTRLHR